METVRKKFKFAEDVGSAEIDWSSCVFCQATSAEPLISPLPAGYKTISSNILIFHQFDALRNPFLSKLLQHNDNLLNLFEINSAKWHKMCSLKFNNTKTERLKEAQRKKDDAETASSTPSTSAPSSNVTDRCKRSHQQDKFPNLCFFCDQEGTEDKPLHRVRTRLLESKIRSCVTRLCNSILQSKLSEGDMLAREQKYHLNCLNAMYNSCRPPTTSASEEICFTIEGIAFSEILQHIEETRQACEENYPIFKLPDLIRRYTDRVKQLLVVHGCSDGEISVHHSRFRDKILSHFGDMRAEKSGREYLLTCEGAVGDSLRLCTTYSYDDDAVHGTLIAKLIRNRILKSKCSFNGDFNAECQIRSTEPLLASLISTILYGKYELTQPVLTICQLITFNTKNSGTTDANVHTVSREPPLPVYLAFKIHAKTRNKELVVKFHQLGLAISYDRFRRISSSICNSVITRMQNEKIACPSMLKLGLFTTSAYDNIDHNPSSTTCSESFHGTSISIFQHPEIGNLGVNRDVIPLIGKSNSRAIPELPQEFTVVPEDSLPVKHPQPNCMLTNFESMMNDVEFDVLSAETPWLLSEEATSWAAYYAKNVTQLNVKSIVSLLPIFIENSKSVGMMKHGLNIIRKTTTFLNHNQTSVIAMDQPLYALAKMIQWCWPNEYGIPNFFILFGSLHIEQAFLKVLGDYLNGSGWTYALVKSGIVSSGTADSLIKVSDIAKTKMFHQITASCLYKLLREAYTHEMDILSNEDKISFEAWKVEKEKTIPTFRYWSTCLNLELLLLQFVKAHRTSDFFLYCKCLKEMCPWFFAMDHYNYARWLSIFVADLVELPKTNPTLHENFQKGFFVVKKTERPFSAIGIDQAHEQNNAVIKGDGGVVGLFTQPSALRRWSIAGPEISSLVTDFENQIFNVSKASSCLDRHHEDSPHHGLLFTRKIDRLKETFTDIGNPFLESSTEMFTLENIGISADSVSVIMKLHQEGKAQYQNFVKERILEKKVSIYDSIPKNNFKIFSIAKNRSNSTKVIHSLKKDVDLFSKLFIICSSREIDMKTLFAYENHPYPPSISNQGALRSGNKSLLIKILESPEKNLLDESDDDSADEEDIDEIPHATTPDHHVIVFDGAAMTHLIQPTTQQKFSDYSRVFSQKIEAEAKRFHSERIDVVWDSYRDLSTKNTTRVGRGTGQRTQVRPNHNLPRNWKTFLRNSDNKVELFSFLSEEIINHIHDVNVCATKGNGVVANFEGNFDNLQPCDHEEADSRIFVHVAHAVECGHTNIAIRTVDSDVVILAVSHFYSLKSNGLEQLFIHFGSGRNYRTLYVHEIAKKLGQPKSIALRSFHAFTGCDTTSFFLGKAKPTMWRKWSAFPKVTDAFLFMAQPQTDLSQEIFSILEQFLVTCYDSSGEESDINDVRQKLFTTLNKKMDALPPSKNALKLHSLRSMYQSAFLWSSYRKNLSPPSPEKWGWKVVDNNFEPSWTSQPEMALSLRELMTCGCKTGCAGSQCGCVKMEIACSSLCKFCHGECANKNSN